MKQYHLTKRGDYWMVADRINSFGYLFVEWADAIRALNFKSCNFVARLFLDLNENPYFPVEEKYGQRVWAIDLPTCTA